MTAPQADTTLAAIALLEQFTKGDSETTSALLDSTDTRELVTGLLDVSRFLAGMVAKASHTEPEQVFSHLRGTLVGLVNDGRLGAGVLVPAEK